LIDHIKYLYKANGGMETNRKRDYGAVLLSLAVRKLHIGNGVFDMGFAHWGYKNTNWEGLTDNGLRFSTRLLSSGYGQ